ncbi:MAG: hypothetical protein VB858_02475, partial [Planctomycetaceae bacterium]
VTRLDGNLPTGTYRVSPQRATLRIRLLPEQQFATPQTTSPEHTRTGHHVVLQTLTIDGQVKDHGGSNAGTD